ncbi:MAG: hypothetical protein COV46_07345 [Deltaproteobacteria bacterium CG11_big_fil_rev_8_21_14_0_20_49_13]|nr:MAG: hypothetical protein COV46_07345 [Deltaproteobacteria bacterium CG11_big_fil_rev_8_21_14_0_20_49_13]
MTYNMRKKYNLLLLSPLLLFLGAAHPAKVTEPKKGDGKTSFYNYHTHKTLDATYRKGERYNEQALKDINDFFKSRSDGKMKDIDINLIEVLDVIQDHFNADVIELISGYRSPALNSALKKRGANVAEESMHLEGKAADIHIDEVTEEAVAEFARGLKAGGVGFYPALDFVHIDTGDLREWRLPDYPGRLLMAFLKGPEWQVMTDRNIYLPGEKINFEILNITRTGKAFNKKAELQRYKRGKWESYSLIEACTGKEFGAGSTCKGEIEVKEETPFGKFRIVIPEEDYPHLNSLSNEFYRKKE